MLANIRRPDYLSRSIVQSYHLIFSPRATAYLLHSLLLAEYEPIELRRRLRGWYHRPGFLLRVRA